MVAFSEQSAERSRVKPSRPGVCPDSSLAAEAGVIATLARDPSPDHRLRALALGLNLWQGAPSDRRAAVEDALLAILASVDYFARLEFAEALARQGEAPRAILDFLLTDDPALQPLLARVRPLGRTNVKAFAAPQRSVASIAAGPLGDARHGPHERGRGSARPGDDVATAISLARRGAVEELVRLLSKRCGYAPEDVRAILDSQTAEAIGLMVQDCGFGPAVLAALVTIRREQPGPQPDLVCALVAYERAVTAVSS